MAQLALLGLFVPTGDWTMARVNLERELSVSIYGKWTVDCSLKFMSFKRI